MSWLLRGGVTMDCTKIGTKKELGGAQTCSTKITEMHVNRRRNIHRHEPMCGRTSDGHVECSGSMEHGAHVQYLRSIPRADVLVEVVQVLEEATP